VEKKITMIPLVTASESGKAHTENLHNFMFCRIVVFCEGENSLRVAIDGGWILNFWVESHTEEGESPVKSQPHFIGRPSSRLLESGCLGVQP